jgi:hypothetical protein
MRKLAFLLSTLLSTAALLFSPCPSVAAMETAAADELGGFSIGRAPQPPPGPGQIRLEGNMIRGGGEMNVPIPKDGWLHIGYTGIGYTGMLCPYTGGKYLTFTQEDVRVYLSIDKGPRHLAGLRVTGPEDVAAVAKALKEESPLRLVLWYTCCLPAEFGELRDLERIAYLRRVFNPHSVNGAPQSALGISLTCDRWGSSPS